MKMVRFNVRLPEDMHKYYMDKSKEMGIPASILILMDLRSYRMLEDANSTLAKAVDIVKGHKSKEQTYEKL